MTNEGTQYEEFITKRALRKAGILYRSSPRFEWKFGVAIDVTLEDGRS